MTETLKIADQTLMLVRKDIKNVHLTVRPPDGTLRIAAPLRMKRKTIETFAITKLPWIRQQQQKLQNQDREEPREFLERESHYLWGRRYLLKFIETDCPPMIEIGVNTLTFRAREELSQEKKQAFFDHWYRAQLREKAYPLIDKWQEEMSVKVEKVFVQKMKTKWGSCNHEASTIRLNSELAKKPTELLEYIIVHELAHLLEPTHNERFISTMDHFLANWRLARKQLNALPIYTAHPSSPHFSEKSPSSRDLPNP